MLTLVCERCGQHTPATPAAWRCPSCGGPLAWRGPERLERSAIRVEIPSLWRYAAVLPVSPAQAISLGEALTPLVTSTLDGAPVRYKLDFLLPSGSFKDRGAAVLISSFRSIGVTHAIEDSSGNAASAIAAYAARAGIACTIFAPARASAGKLVQAAAYGARVVRVEGSREDVAKAAMEAAAADPAATYASHNWHPFFLEGVKTWALEVWEQLEHRMPHNLVVPAGSGSMVLGAALAVRQLQPGGNLTQLPRLFAIQPAACAPLDVAFRAGLNDTPPIQPEPTIAEGTSIAAPVRGREVLAAIRHSGGQTVAVSEAEIVDAFHALARHGLYAEPTSAVAVAGARRLIASGVIGPGEETVILLSGSGLKATETIARLFTNPS